MSPNPPESPQHPLMPLSMIESGRKVHLVTVRAGRGLARRLAEMGFVPGEELQVVTNNVAGPIIVIVKGSRLVLGRGMAHKIIVQ